MTTDLGRPVNAEDMVIQADGKIVITGPSQIMDSDFEVLRFNPDGSLDPTFGGDGAVGINMFGTDRALALAIQQDGRIVVGGERFAPIGDIIEVARLNPEGSLDTTFGREGRTSINFLDGLQLAEHLSAVAIQGDGKIVAGGILQPGGPGRTDFAMWRLTSDGKLDLGFREGFSFPPRVATDLGSDDEMLHDIAIQPDGKILAAGYTTNPTTFSDFAVVRYNSDGTLDEPWDGDGILTTDFGGLEQALGIAVQPDGKVLAAGFLGGRIALARYTSIGALDAGFGAGGMVTTRIPGKATLSLRAADVALQSDGRIVIVGSAREIGHKFGCDFLTARYEPDGSLDHSFGDGGITTTDFGACDFATTVAIQSDGDVVAAGGVHNESGPEIIALARYLGADLPPAVAAALEAAEADPNTVPSGVIDALVEADQNGSLTVVEADTTVDDNLKLDPGDAVILASGSTVNGNVEAGLNTAVVVGDDTTITGNLQGGGLYFFSGTGVRVNGNIDDSDANEVVVGEGADLTVNGNLKAATLHIKEDGTLTTSGNLELSNSLIMEANSSLTVGGNLICTSALISSAHGSATVTVGGNVECAALS